MLTASRTLADPCPVCLSPINYAGRGRKPVYCSPECRSAAYSNPAHMAADARRKRWERARDAARAALEAKYGCRPEYARDADGRLILDAEDARLLAALYELAPESATGGPYRAASGAALDAAADAELENPGFDGSDLRRDDWRYGPLRRASRRNGYLVTLTEMATTDPTLGWVSGEYAFDRKARHLVHVSKIDPARPEDFEVRRADDGATDEWISNHYYDASNRV